MNSAKLTSNSEKNKKWWGELKPKISLFHVWVGALIFAIFAFSIAILIIFVVGFPSKMELGNPLPHLQILNSKSGEIIVPNIPVLLHYSSKINREIEMKSDPLIFLESKAVIVYFENKQPDDDAACSKNSLQIPSPTPTSWNYKTNDQENVPPAPDPDDDWILIVDDLRNCDLKRKILNAQFAGFSEIIIFTSSSLSPSRASQFQGNIIAIEKYWRENLSQIPFLIDVTFISEADGFYIRNEFAYPRHFGYSVKVIPELRERTRRWRWFGSEKNGFENVVAFILVIALLPLVLLIIKANLDFCPSWNLLYHYLRLDVVISTVAEIISADSYSNEIQVIAESKPVPEPEPEEPPRPAVRYTSKKARSVIVAARHNNEILDLSTFLSHQYPDERSEDRLLITKRSNFETNRYLDIYRRQRFERTDAKRKLKVHFLNEQGLDYGGPSKEYLCMLRTALQNGVPRGKSIFGGNPNHLIFMWDEELLDNEWYFAAGHAVCEIAYGAGINYALAGLSPSLLEQILRSGRDRRNPVTVHREDLCDEDVLYAFDTLTKITQDEEVSQEEIKKVMPTLKEYGVCSSGILFNKKDVESKRDQLCQKFLVEFRLPELKQFQEGLEAGGLLDYFHLFPLALSTVFPRIENTRIEMDVLRCKIQIVVGEGLSPFVLINVHRYLDEIADDQKKIKHILLQWTGSEDVPIGMLRVQESHQYDLFFGTCDCILYTHLRLNYDMFKILVEESQHYNHT